MLSKLENPGMALQMGMKRVTLERGTEGERRAA
jgi:hypothetical protein